jgi:transcriptional antiterminator RfaH
MKADFISNWLVVYTKPQSEKKASSQLIDLGINHLLPLKKEVRQWHDRKKIINSPIFPSYIFVQPQNVKSYFDVLELNSIINYVKIGKEVAIVPELTIKNISILISLDCELEVSNQTVKKGQNLLIKQGPFSGLNCEVVNIEKKDKILVRLDIFNRHLIVDIPDYNLV